MKLFFMQASFFHGLLFSPKDGGGIISETSLANLRVSIWEASTLHSHSCDSLEPVDNHVTLQFQMLVARQS
jgi:hypothetical protein